MSAGAEIIVTIDCLNNWVNDLEKIEVMKSLVVFMVLPTCIGAQIWTFCSNLMLYGLQVVLLLCRGVTLD